MPQQSSVFDSAFGNSQAAPSATGGPFDAAFGSPAATAQASNGASSSNTGSPFDVAFAGTPAAGPALRQAPADENAPWYSRVWDWANTPLWNLNPENKGGFVGGLEDVASGLTSPLSIGLTAATFGGGAALRALGLVGKEIPMALQGVRTLMEAGFTGQQIFGAVHESPRLLDALKYGDYESAKRIGVHLLANAGFGALGLRKTIPEAGALAKRVGFIKASAELAGVREEYGKYQLDVERAAHEADGLERAARRGLQEPGTLPRDQQYAYRARDVGEQGIPSESHSQATMSLDEARRYLASRGKIQGTPQELVRVDLDRLASEDFQRMRGPNEADWIKFSKPIPESMVERAEGQDFAEPSPAEKLNAKQRGTLLGGITRFIEAGGDQELLSRRKAALEASNAVKENYSAKERRALLDKYDAAQNLTPAQEAFAHRIRGSFEQDMEEAYQHGIIRNAVENYVSHVWEDDPTNVSANRTKFQAASRQFDTSLSAARARTFSTLFDGEVLGRQAAVDDPVALMSRYRFDLQKAIAARSFLERLQDRDLRMPDGRAIVAAAGRGQTIGGDDSPATLINPKAARSIRIAQPVIDAMRDTGELEKHLDAGTIREIGTKLVPIETGRAIPQPLPQPRGWADVPAQPVSPDELTDLSRALGRPVSEQELPGILRRQAEERNVGEALQGNRRDVIAEIREPYRARLEGGNQIEQAKPQPGEIVDQNGRRFRVEPTYAWESGDYQAIDHSAFRDWNFATNAPDGSPIFVKSDLRVHPDAAEFIKRAIGADRSPIRDLKIGDVPVGRKFLKISSEGKHLLLSLSPFHLVQEGLRAVMTGISPFGKLDFDLNDSDLAFGVTHGLTLGGSRRSLADFTEGVASHSSIINKIPGLRSLQGEMQSFLFDKYIPGLKARAYKSLFERYQKAYKDISPAEAAQLAAAHSNELFGGLNYGQMGRSMATQDFLRATTLAPDWLESEMRSLYRALDPQRGGVMRQDIMRMAAILFGASRVLNYMTSGQAHMEAPFGVVVPGQKGEDDKVYTLRTLPTDMMHAVTNSRDFIAGRVNPLSVRPAVEFLTGRDRQGRKVEFPQEASDFFSAFAPILATNIANKLQDIGNLSGPEVVARTLGASTYQYKTEAEKLAHQLASDRMASGPLSGEQLAAHRRKLRAEATLRAGQEPDLTEFSAREKREIRKNAELTALQSYFSRLPMESALAIWDAASPQERAMLVPEFLKKKNSYMRAHNADTLAEKRSNRTYQRLLVMFAEGAPEITTPTANAAPASTSVFDSAFAR